MAKDIVPELYEKIQKEFTDRNNSDKTIKLIFRKVGDGTITLPEGHTYAERLGVNLSETLLNNLNENTLPDGRLYWNIADRTVRPLLMQNYEEVNSLAAEIQLGIDERENIGLAVVKGVDPSARVRGLVEKATAEAELNDALKWLEEPIINCTESFFDNFVIANADARYKAGFDSKIVRTAHTGCCNWCLNLVGEYRYADLRHGALVYARHLYCRCVVTFQNGQFEQDVWSKIKYKPGELTIAEREKIGEIRAVSEKMTMRKAVERRARKTTDTEEELKEIGRARIDTGNIAEREAHGLALDIRRG